MYFFPDGVIKKPFLNTKAIKVKRALISVYDKTGVIDLVKNLTSLNIEILYSLTNYLHTNNVI